jgi:hypothetical protein
MEGESATCFSSFCVYRDLGPQRTLAKAAEIAQRSTAVFEGYSKKGNWVARAAAWDLAKDRAAREAELEAIRDMRKRHVEIALNLQQLGLLSLESYLKRVQEQGAVLSAEELLKVLRQGTDLERLTRGEPQQITETTVRESIDYTKLSPDDLQELRRIKRKMNKPDV